MATDYAELEREFLASLAADSGRDLAAWMALIDAQKLNHRNDIIDWLRQQGFMFARASWLERIHHNGGRPVYLAALPGSTPPAAASGASFPSRRPLPRGAEAGVAASPAQDHASTPASAEPPARSPPPDTQVPPPPVPTSRSCSPAARPTASSPSTCWRSSRPNCPTPR